MDYRGWNENNRYNEAHTEGDGMSFDDLSDDDKKALLNRMQSGQSGQSPDEGMAINHEFHSDDSQNVASGNQPQRSPDLNGLMAQKSTPEMDNSPQPNITGPGEYLKQGFKLYDQQIANRPRAAALAALRGQSPIDAAIQNNPTSGEDIAKEGFKTLNPEVTQTTNPQNVLMKQGDALKSLEVPVGMAASAALDPISWVPGGGVAKEASMAERFVPQLAESAEKIPLAERASAPFMSKTGKGAESFPNIEAALSRKEQQMLDLRKEIATLPEHSFEYKNSVQKLNKLKFGK